MRHFIFCKIFIGILIASLFPPMAFSLESDQDMPLQIRADTVDFNHQKGITIYRGHVKLDQGTTHLLADTLTTHSDEQNKLQEAIATGSPAIYKTLTAPNKAEFTATAITIKYYPQQNYVQLIGDAETIQGTDSFKAPQIDYNTKLHTVTSPPSTNGKTTIVFEPK